MNVQVPFGGKKQSGIGREFGEYVCVWYPADVLATDYPLGTASIYRAKDCSYQVSYLPLLRLMLLTIYIA
jgi:acyl-CoA reductase-like NAD-dependent aldehyde dehydrogenase